MSEKSILVVDDEPDLRAVYEMALLREGYKVDTAGSVGEGERLLKLNQYDVMITDMRLPDGFGLELVKLVSENKRHEKCLVVTAYGSAENAVEALKSGAFDYLTKPVNLKHLRKVVADAIMLDEEVEIEVHPSTERAVKSKGNKNVNLPPVQESAPAPTDEASQQLLGHSQIMEQVRDIIKRVASTMAPVLIHGESGTGKELVARAIHQHSHRKRGPFIAVNCGAIPENLMEAEFFGYMKGSFTGAVEDKEGLFASAAGGTIFLDELGELPLAMQAKLLRVIQERAVRRLGGHEEEILDVRVLSATHRNLAKDVGAGLFRQDLFYRLNVIEVFVPPLRQRKEDIEEITESILKKIAYESSLPIIPIFESSAIAKLQSYAYPGNVRELENILQRAVAMCDGSVIYAQDLMMQQHAAVTSEQEGLLEPHALHQDKAYAGGGAGGTGASAARNLRKESGAIASSSPSHGDGADTGELPANLSDYLDDIERVKLIKALELHNFNRTAAGAQLGLSLRQIRYRMERLKIDVPEDE